MTQHCDARVRHEDTPPPFLAADPDIYEHFMGRWSDRLAEPFLDFVGCQPGSNRPSSFCVLAGPLGEDF